MMLDLVYWTDEEVTGGGPYYRASDVDALLARIREALDAERDATLRHVLSRAKDRAPAFPAAERACAALDALLADGGE